MSEEERLASAFAEAYSAGMSNEVDDWNKTKPELHQIGHQFARRYYRALAATPMTDTPSGAVPPRAALDYEQMRKDRGWPTPNHMRRTAEALDSLTPARYGDVLRWFADRADAALAATEAPERTCNHFPGQTECDWCRPTEARPETDLDVERLTRALHEVDDDVQFCRRDARNLPVLAARIAAAYRDAKAERP